METIAHDVITQLPGSTTGRNTENSAPLMLSREKIIAAPAASLLEAASEEGRMLLLDKPYSESSFYLVNKLRKRLSQTLSGKKIKVGHAGTLDPLATGLLIIATRKQTKQIDSIVGLGKTYTLTLRLGITSESYDLERPITVVEIPEMTHEFLETTLRRFEGTQQQVPPIFSAIKQQGRPVYHLARKGETPEMTARQIEISRLNILDIRLPYLRLQIDCSKGTYVRSLVRDIGLALGTEAVMTELRRDKIGEHSVEDALTYEELEHWLACKES